jgi:hypothetical protein
MGICAPLFGRIFGRLSRGLRRCLSWTRAGLVGLGVLPKALDYDYDNDNDNDNDDDDDDNGEDEDEDDSETNKRLR